MYPPHRLLVLHCSQYQHNVLPQHPFYTHFARMSPHHHDNRTDTGCAYWLNRNSPYAHPCNTLFQQMYMLHSRLQHKSHQHNWSYIHFVPMPQHHRGNLQDTGCAYWLNHSLLCVPRDNSPFQQMYMPHLQLQHKSRHHNWSCKHLYLLPLYHRDN